MRLSLTRCLSFGRTATLTALAILATANSAHANSVSVVNGNFSQTTVNSSSEFGGQFPSQQVTGWTTNGYAAVFLPGTADTTGATLNYGARLWLWGPGTGSNNGLTASSPDGGNFIAMDANFLQGPLGQQIDGLTVGQLYSVNFYYAAAQQYNYFGPNTEGFEVAFGNQLLDTPVLSIGNAGFSGWKSESLVFTAGSTSQYLSFLAVGGPSGAPPFALLDGVSITAVPEPSSVALMLTGLSGLGGLVRSRFKKQ